MIYLDNSATGGFKPLSVQNAVLSSLKFCANPGRSGHRLSLAAAERVNACRALLSELFHGPDLERVVFTRSCTEALNLALFGTLEKGDHVVTTALEHNSVLRPLEKLKQEGRIDYSIAPLKDGKLDLETFFGLIRKSTKLVAVTSASNVSGESPDLKAIRENLPPSVLLLSDGAQGGGHLPIDMKRDGIDLLALAGHKGLYAMQGAGALLFSERVELKPLLFGGTGSESFNLSMPDFYPDRLEAGTLSYPAIVSLYEGALYTKVRREEHAKKLLFFTSKLKSELPAGYLAYFSPNPCGIAAIRSERFSSEELAYLLSERYDICVRGGLHCAPLFHKASGTFPDGLLRASFSPENSLSDLSALLNALEELKTISL